MCFLVIVLNTKFLDVLILHSNLFISQHVIFDEQNLSYHTATRSVSHGPLDMVEFLNAHPMLTRQKLKQKPQLASQMALIASTIYPCYLKTALRDPF